MLDSVVVSVTGPGNGLRLYLNIEQYEYTKDPGMGVGIKVIQHDVIDQKRYNNVSPNRSNGALASVCISHPSIS